ncbi:MAG TPA: hypothetical protein PLV86_09045 [Candidatus Fermentibacter daniensis]|nr:hypothetical protein [Candidatus Fermentibacter daniensis]HQM41886.1 hypothetical protein [Candidatus Fermentibacter daniensis]
MHLAGEHLSRGTRDHEFNPLRFEDATGETVPSFYILHLIEEPVAGVITTQFRVGSEILFEKEIELFGSDAFQSIIVEIEKDGPLRRDHCTAIGLKLAEKRSLPGAPHSDHRMDLAGYVRKPGITRGELRRRGRQHGRVQHLCEHRIWIHTGSLPERWPPVKPRFAITWTSQKATFGSGCWASGYEAPP